MVFEKIRLNSAAEDLPCTHKALGSLFSTGNPQTNKHTTCLGDVINCGWPCCSQTPSLVKTNSTAPSAKLNKKSACQIRFGGGVRNKPTLGVNSIKTLKTGEWENDMISLCLFIASQTQFQVRLSLKITLMSRSHMACNRDVSGVA